MMTIVCRMCGGQSTLEPDMKNITASGKLLQCSCNKFAGKLYTFSKIIRRIIFVLFSSSLFELGIYLFMGCNHSNAILKKMVSSLLKPVNKHQP